MGTIIAVLTGDLVKSSRLSSKTLDRTRHALRAAADEIKTWRRGLVPGKPDFFRGDSWQMVVTEPGFALRVSIYLRASLIAEKLADTRIAIGLGHSEVLNPRRVSLSIGQAFTLSGQLLDKLSRPVRMSVAAPLRPAVLASWLAVVVELCDIPIRHLTARQAQVLRLTLALSNPTHHEIAQRLSPSVSQQAVTKALAGADWSSLHLALERFEKTNWHELCLSAEQETT